MESDLKKLKCMPCSGKTLKLNQIEINTNLKKIDNWNTNDEIEMIYKKFTFKSFKQALNFANLVGEISDNEGHHPDLSIGWGYCLIMIHTHAIKGLSMNDFILASKIDSLKNNL